MKPHIAIKSDLFAAEFRAPKIDSLGDPLVKISEVVDFGALASEVDRVAPRVVLAKGCRPPLPTETMVRILVLKRLTICRTSKSSFSCWIGRVFSAFAV